MGPSSWKVALSEPPPWKRLRPTESPGVRSESEVERLTSTAPLQWRSLTDPETVAPPTKVVPVQ